MSKISEYNLKLLLEGIGRYSSRMAGYYEHRQSYTFIKNQLSEYINVEFYEEDRTIDSWLCEYSSLYYESEHLEIEHYPLVMSPSGGALADLITIYPYYSLDNVSGKIALAFCNSTKVRNRLYSKIHDKGGLAVIFVSTTPGFYVRITRLDGHNIPAMATTLEQGLSMARKGGKVYVYQETSTPPSRVVDIITRIYGRLDDEVLLYSHYDSIPYSGGAMDNAAGTAILLELIRILKNKHPRMTLRFHISGWGELGGFKTAKKDSDRLRIIVDSIGLFYTKLSILVSSGMDENILRLLSEIAREFRIDLRECKLKDRVVIVTDRHNIAVHTPEDTINKVSPLKLRYACTILYALIKKLNEINF